MAWTTPTRLIIPSGVIAETTKCQKGFSCLTQPVKTLCKVNHCIMDKVLCVQCASLRSCSYKYSCGDRCFCTCPTRLAINAYYRI